MRLCNFSNLVASSTLSDGELFMANSLDTTHQDNSAPPGDVAPYRLIIGRVMQDLWDIGSKFESCVRQ